MAHFLEDDARPFTFLKETLADLRPQVMRPAANSALESDAFAVAKTADKIERVSVDGQFVVGSDAQILNRYITSTMLFVEDNSVAVYRLTTHPDTLAEGQIWHSIVGVHERNILEGIAQVMWVIAPEEQSERLARYARRFTADASLQRNFETTGDDRALRALERIRDAVARASGLTREAVKITPRPRNMLIEALGTDAVNVYDRLSQHVHHSPTLDALFSSVESTNSRVPGFSNDDYDNDRAALRTAVQAEMTKMVVAVVRYIK